MKTYKIKNYKGNIVESLTKFAKSHEGMKIVEATEDGSNLKIVVEENSMDDYLEDKKNKTLRDFCDKVIKLRHKWKKVADQEYHMVGSADYEPLSPRNVENILFGIWNMVSDLLNGEKNISNGSGILANAALYTKEEAKKKRRIANGDNIDTRRDFE